MTTMQSDHWLEAWEDLIAENTRLRDSLFKSDPAGLALVERVTELEGALYKTLTELGCHVATERGRFVCCCDNAVHAWLLPEV